MFNITVKKSVFLVFILTVLTAHGFSQTSPFLSGDEGTGYLPENYEIRSKLESWIHAPINEARSESLGVFRQSSDGRMIKVRIEESRDFFYQLFLIEKDYSYPVAAKGNFIIKRDKSDGSFLQVKIFLRNEEGSFIRIFPSMERTVIDVYLLGRKVFGDIIIPLNMNRVFTSPVKQIMEVSSSRIDWSVFQEPPPSVLFENETAIIDKIRAGLNRIYDCDDGAMDSNGKFIYIETLEEQTVKPGGFNCSGFVKWIADGFMYPVTDSLLDIESLKEKHHDYRGNSWSEFSEDERDPYFGLDWTRNIAVTLSGLKKNGFSVKNMDDLSNFQAESSDVREVPFFSYTEDIGFPVGDLEAVLYLLAMNEPGYFYLGSLNVPYGEGQVLRQHTHVAALFPYFSSTGRFHIAVFERNRETGIDSLKNRYGTDFIHLVRISSDGLYELP